MAYVFSTGRIVYGGKEVGTLSDWDIEDSAAVIPLQGNMRAPTKVALGPGTVKGSCKLNAFDPQFLATITNSVMGVAGSETSLVWYVTDTAGVIHTITMPNVALSGIKLTAGQDKWLQSEMSWEAACAGGTGNIIAYGTVGSIPALSAITSAWVFSTGAFTINGNTVGTMSDLNISIDFQTIPLTSNMRYPVAVAQGPVKVSGSTKFNAFDTNFLATVSNSVMAPPTSDVAAVWTFIDSAAVTHTITLPAVQVSSKKITAGVDKWIQTDLAFEAMAAVADSNILEVA